MTDDAEEERSVQMMKGFVKAVELHSSTVEGKNHIVIHGERS